MLMHSLFQQWFMEGLRMREVVLRGTDANEGLPTTSWQAAKSPSLYPQCCGVLAVDRGHIIWRMGPSSHDAIHWVHWKYTKFSFSCITYCLLDRSSTPFFVFFYFLYFIFILVFNIFVDSAFKNIFRYILKVFIVYLKKCASLHIFWNETPF